MTPSHSYVNIETRRVTAAFIPLYISMPILGVLVPLCIAGPQIVVGSLVNILIIFYALRFPARSGAIMCMMPSIGAIGNGLLFGTLTPFLIFFIPSIWLGNMALVLTVQKLSHDSLYVRVAVGAMIKTMVVFLMANMLIWSHVVPQSFRMAMGVTQFVTALIGGFLAIRIYKSI